MKVNEVFLWIWAINWFLSSLLVAIIGAKYYIRYGFKAVITDLSESDMKKLKFAFGFFLLGILFLILGLLLK